METRRHSDLITEARKFITPEFDCAEHDLIRRMADALEAVTAENESLRRFDWLKRNRGVEAERDEALAVIEDIRKALPGVIGQAEIARILSRIPEHPKED